MYIFNNLYAKWHLHFQYVVILYTNLKFARNETFLRNETSCYGTILGIGNCALSYATLYQ